MTTNFTIGLINQALDALMLRETATAFNISQANNLHKSAYKVSFEDQLQSMHSIEDLAPFHPEIKETGQPIKLDQEMATSLQTTTQYRALIKGINMQFSIMQIAMKGSS